MIHTETKYTVDLYPELTPLERHVLFLETYTGKITQLRYAELLRAHCPKKDLPKWRAKQPEPTLIDRFKQFLINIK